MDLLLIHINSTESVSNIARAKVLKIVFISELVHGGGTETFLRNLITGLCRYALNVKIVVATSQQVSVSTFPSCIAKLYIVPRDRLWFQSRLIG